MSDLAARLAALRRQAGGVVGADSSAMAAQAAASFPQAPIADSAPTKQQSSNRLAMDLAALRLQAGLAYLDDQR